MFVRSKLLRSPHAFATRRGGVSREAHTKSLNLAFNRGDSDKTVLDNLEIFARAVGFCARDTVSLPQIHSDRILTVGENERGYGYFEREGIEECDGYVTSERNVVIGIKTADCVPILFEAEKDGRVIAVGATHAGWRGTAAKIAPACIERLCREFGADRENVRVAIGPSIHSCCYEVGEDLYASVRESLGQEIADKYVTAREGSCDKYSCDLQGINRHLLLSAGLREENIDTIELCTCCHPELFFSHRYSNGVRGTMLNVIFMDKDGDKNG